MADDRHPPESILLNQFGGIRNNVSSGRLAPNELERAINVDVDDAGQLRRRRGRRLVDAGRYHSLFSTFDGRTFVVKNGVLCGLDDYYAARPLMAGAGDDPIAYVEVGNDVYFSSRAVSGVIRRDDVVEPWGEQGGAGEWLSPVVTPTETLHPVAGRMLARPPLATALAHLNGRIYLASGALIWATEVFAYTKVDRTRNFIQFEADIGFIGAVSDGLYVGCATGVYFMTGPFEQMRRLQVSRDAALPGSLTHVPPGAVIGKQTVTRDAVMFMTTSGLVAGFDAGVTSDLTESKVEFPTSQHVAPLLRRQDGITSYVGVTDSRGSPVSSARIGDYVDAEVRRFRG
jgi:hypothetical protein